LLEAMFLTQGVETPFCYGFSHFTDKAQAESSKHAEARSEIIVTSSTSARSAGLFALRASPMNRAESLLLKYRYIDGYAVTQPRL